ncbi:MAG: ABC transporter [Chromatiaceae bacterium]|nr:MAG: ABC transporter [Chromatiaceae bacterium]
MHLDLLWEPLFRLPFLTGLVLALLLPLLGLLLLLREEWLAALGLAHLAAAGALAALVVGAPAVLGGALAALAAVLLKTLAVARGNLAYAAMILLGWSLLLLLAANSAIGTGPGADLIEGQLYFAGPIELGAALLLGLLALVLLPGLMPRLLRARLWPAHEAMNRLPAWRWHLGFDALAALGMAVSTASLGVMGAFALVLLPAWLAFRLAASWRQALGLAAAIGCGGYLLAFVLALLFDQPFAPVLVLALLLLAAVVAASMLTWRRRTRRPAR